MKFVVYFLQHPVYNLIKIGRTYDFRQRYLDLCQEFGVDLQILGVQEGGCELERSLHSHFAHCRYIYEWFQPNDELADYIKQHTQPETFTYMIRMPPRIHKEYNLRLPEKQDRKFICELCNQPKYENEMHKGAVCKKCRPPKLRPYN